MYLCSDFFSMTQAITPKRELSVLIPTYNQVCLPLVRLLSELLQAEGISHEILVADDGSTDEKTIAENRAIDELPCCRYIIRKKNVGRAAIRNFLVQESSFKYLLLIDSDMTILSDKFVHRYINCTGDDVVDGGVAIHGDEEVLKGNLRYLYEKSVEADHSAPERQKNPHQHLHTANLLVRRDIMIRCPFDERFRHYGYEDVLLGKLFHRKLIKVEHIDNPLGFCTFESNAEFMDKTEEGLRTLFRFQKELKGYSRMLTFVSGIHIGIIKLFIRLWHRLFGKMERRNLCSSHPSLKLFQLYRLGYFLSLKNEEEKED